MTHEILLELRGALVGGVIMGMISFFAMLWINK